MNVRGVGPGLAASAAPYALVVGGINRLAAQVVADQPWRHVCAVWVLTSGAPLHRDQEKPTDTMGSALTAFVPRSGAPWDHLLPGGCSVSERSDLGIICIRSPAVTSGLTCEPLRGFSAQRHLAAEFRVPCGGLA